MLSGWMSLIIISVPSVLSRLMVQSRKLSMKLWRYKGKDMLCLASLGAALGAPKNRALPDEAAARRRPRFPDSFPPSQCKSRYAHSHPILKSHLHTTFCFRSVFVRSIIDIISDIADLRAHSPEHTHTVFKAESKSPYVTRTLNSAYKAISRFETKIGSRNATYCLFFVIGSRQDWNKDGTS